MIIWIKIRIYDLIWIRNPILWHGRAFTAKMWGERFKSQNRFVIEAINYYYKRVMRIQEDPYLEMREKEDAFADRIVGKVEMKVLFNLPALLGLYVKKDYEEE